MGANKSILVVDDDPSVVDLLQTVLEGSGYTVETAFDGREALEAVVSGSPSLILLDLTMPVMDGKEFFHRMRRDLRLQIPVVIMSAMDDARHVARTVGAEGWLNKPFELDRLLSCVSRLMG